MSALDRPCIPPPGAADAEIDAEALSTYRRTIEEAHVEESADSERPTEPGGYTPDLDVAARVADAGTWYESEGP